MRIFCFLTVAAIVTAIWTTLDRAHRSYPRLYQGLRIYVRYSLAATMITYDAVKVIKSQFPNPGLDRLTQPFGEASPMGLLWTFMGASESYNLFTGAGEFLGGLLLTTRRTTLVGALVCFGVMSHVAMLNFSYDVPAPVPVLWHLEGRGIRGRRQAPAAAGHRRRTMETHRLRPSANDRRPVDERQAPAIRAQT